jgi:hypothetical protein
VAALIASLALVGALAFDAFGLGPRWLGDRIAAILALHGFSYFILGSALAGWLLTAGANLQTALGNALAGPLGPKAASAIGTYGLGMLVLMVFVLWMAAMLPKRISNHAGEAVHQEMNSALIWGGALILVIGASLVPGALGGVVRGTVGWTNTIGQAIAGAAA